MGEFQQIQKEWIENNPLRKFRKEHELAIMGIAPALEVSTNTIQSWEMGAKTPSDENFEKIGRFIGDRHIEDSWEAWKEQRPSM